MYLANIIHSGIDLWSLSHSPGSDSVEGECVFEGDYAVPPLPVTEGMQHIRIMEGVSRSLPSSPLLSHQALNMRLQPLKRLPGNIACVCKSAQAYMCCRCICVACVRFVCQREPPPVSHLKHCSWMPELPPRARMPSPYTPGRVWMSLTM